MTHRVDPAPNRRPIGYWLKRLDGLITERTSQALTRFGLTRTHWQVLHTLSKSAGLTRASLLDRLSDFVDEPRLDGILADFQTRAWLAPDQTGALALNEQGRAAHQQVHSQQAEVRQRMMRDVTRAEYTQTLRILQRMAKNLETPTQENPQ